MQTIIKNNLKRPKSVIVRDYNHRIVNVYTNSNDVEINAVGRWNVKAYKEEFIVFEKLT